MSNLDINTMFEVVSKAKEAVERIPSLERTVSEQSQSLDAANDEIERLKAQLIATSEANAALNETIRSLEVERDDAGFRELEASDKLDVLLRAFSTANGLVQQAVMEVTPKLPEPPQAIEEPITEPMPEAGIGHNSLPTVEEIFDRCDEPRPVWATPQTAEVPREPVATFEPKPFLGMAAHDKPDNVSWYAFLAGGGVRPFWLSDSEIEASRYNNVA